VSRSRAPRIAVLSVACAFAGALPATAGATVVELHDGMLAVADRGGVANVLDVKQLSLVEFEVSDAAGGLEPGVGCGLLSPQVARCAGNALSVRVDAGAGDDLIGLWDVPLPVQLHGGDGDDALAGGRGPDQLWGGEGDDSLSGNDGEDRVAAEAGGDFADGNAGADTVLGGDGDDILEGQRGDGDLVTGDDGRDLIAGGGGDDRLEGGAGDDTLIGGRGRDAIGTGLGNDEVFGGGGGVNKIDCRRGDRVRGQSGSLPAGCAPLPSSSEPPDTWPPEAASVARAAQAPTYKVFSEPIARGAAHHYWVWAGAAEDVHRKVRIRLKFRDGDNVLKRRCLNEIWTNKQVWRKAPRKARTMTRITGRVRVAAQCP